jgi:hypothetical protein
MSSVFELRVIFMALDTRDLRALYALRLAELEVLASSCDREKVLKDYECFMIHTMLWCKVNKNSFGIHKDNKYMGVINNRLLVRQRSLRSFSKETLINWARRAAFYVSLRLREKMLKLHCLIYLN